MGVDRISHLLRQRRIDVILLQLGAHAVDQPFPQGSVNGHVLQHRSGRQGTQAKGGHGRRLPILDQEIAQRRGRPALLFHPEANVQRLTALDRQQLESACLVTESDYPVDRLLLIDSLNVRLDPGSVATIEGVKPCLEGVSGGSIRDGSLCQATSNAREQQR